MNARMRDARHAFRAVLLLGTLVACGRSTGCSGCDVDGPPFPEKDRVHSAAQVRLTSHGIEFLEENLEPILEEVLPEEGLEFCLPGDGGDIIGLVQWGYCQDDRCPDGAPGCNVNIAIGGVDLQAVEPDRLRAVITFEQLAARFDIRATPIVDCSLSIDAPGFPVQIDLQFSTPEPTRDLTFALQDPVYRLAAANIRLQANDGFLSFLCTAIDAVLNFPVIGDFIFDTLQVLVDGVLLDLVTGFVEDFTCRQCETDRDCPIAGGAACLDGRCMVDGVCLPTPLGVEGFFDLGGLLSGFSPGLNARLQYLLAAGSYVQVENQGLSLGIIGGAISDRNRCVPRRPQPPLVPEPARAPSLRGNLDPHGRPFEAGIGITQEMLDHALWAAFNSGVLCLALTSAQIEQLNAMTLGIAFPNLRHLTRGNAPLALTLAPQEVPIITIGANTTMPDPRNEGQVILDEPLLTVEMPDLWIDFHAFMEDRWVRIFSIRADVVLPIGLAFDADDGIIPLLGNLSGALQNIETANGEIMLDDPRRLEMLLPVLIGPLISLAADSLSDPISIPDIMGYRLNLQEGSITGIENNTLIGLFAGLERSPEVNAGMGAAFHVETEARALEVFAPPVEVFEAGDPEAWRAAHVRLSLDAYDGTRDEAPMEFSWRVPPDGWSHFTPASEMVVRSPLFALQGRHSIEVRARRQDDYRTLDPSPAVVPVIIDSVPPELTLTPEDDTLRIEATDLVTATEALRVEVRRGGGAWSLVSGDRVALAEGETITVRVTDEVGNATEARHVSRGAELIGRQPPGGAEGGDGCDCDVGQGSRQGPGAWLAALLAMGLLRRRRERSRHGMLAALLVLVVAAVALGGCDDNSRKGDGDGDDDAGPQRDRGPPPPPECVGDEDCPENQACRDGVCTLINCTQDPSLCEDIKCEDGSTSLCNALGVCACAEFCPGGCADTEYCCLPANACQPLPPICEGISCEVGFQLRVTQEGQVNPQACEREGVECDCVELDPLPLGAIGRFSDLVVSADAAYISAYADDYGDLVVGRWTPEDGLTWQWIDGVPDGEITGGPSGPRGGIATPGPNVGQHTSIALGAEGRLHVAYFDVTNRALKYALGVPGPEGHTWTLLALDADGEAGRWTSISVDARGVPGIAYRVSGLPGAGGDATEVRYLLAKNPAPGGPTDWNTPFTVAERVIDPEDRSLGYPLGTGLFTAQVRGPDGLPVVAWYDRSAGSLWMSRLEDAGFSEPLMLAGWEHPERDADMGTNVDITLDGEGELHLCFQDGATDSLRYLAPGLGLDEWVDDGIRVDTGGREYSVHVVGEDCNVRIDADGRPLIVYQDATGHQLLLARRNSEGGWVRQVLRGDERPYAGAFGFYASAQVRAAQLWVSNYVFRHHEDPPAQFIEVFRHEL